MAMLMMQKAYPGDATVTVCHSRSKDLVKECREADIIIAALGQPNFVKADMVKEGAVKKVRKLNTRTILLSMMRPGTFVKSEGCSIASPTTPILL